GVTDMVLDPKNADIIYASAYSRQRHVGQAIGGSMAAGVFKSTDGGKKWTKLTNGLPKCDMGRTALAIEGRTNPVQIFALVESQFGSSGFYRSIDNGASWVRYGRMAPQTGGRGGPGGGAG